MRLTAAGPGALTSADRLPRRAIGACCGGLAGSRSSCPYAAACEGAAGVRLAGGIFYLCCRGSNLTSLYWKLRETYLEFVRLGFPPEYRGNAGTVSLPHPQPGSEHWHQTNPCAEAEIV